MYIKPLLQIHLACIFPVLIFVSAFTSGHSIKLFCDELSFFNFNVYSKLLLNAGQKYCRMLQVEHSAILLAICHYNLCFVFF